mmetsp:Transcript_28346/g.64324  ORF Transcript_28346/g.64324 Transcript_28346/m.64324 type:complete len:209 (+) Transcript_28346:111-737(+)
MLRAAPVPTVLAQIWNQPSLLKAETQRFTSCITCSRACCGPTARTICSADGPVPTASPTETLACVVSRSCLMAAPPLPMRPPTADLGASARSFRAPVSPSWSDTDELFAQHSASFAMICVVTSARDSSVLAWQVRMRHSVPGYMSLCSVSVILACVLCRMAAIDVPPLPMTAAASASGASSFTAKTILLDLVGPVELVELSELVVACL